MINKLLGGLWRANFRFRGVKIGRNVNFYGPVIIKYPKRCVIGNNVNINDLVLLNAKGGISIGDNVTISAGCHIHSTGLVVDGENRCHVLGKVTLGNNVWLGANAVVLKDVSISENIIVGANSLVNKSLVEPGVYVGSPVRRIEN